MLVRDFFFMYKTGIHGWYSWLHVLVFMLFILKYEVGQLKIAQRVNRRDGGHCVSIAFAREHL